MAPTTRPLASTLVLALLLAPAAADVTVRVSLTSTGGQANDACGTGPVNAVAISDSGLLVAFVAAASNLVPGDTNGLRDVFVRDLAQATTERVSLSAAGDEPDQPCDIPRLSANGRYCFFQGFASNLVPGDTNGWSDVFRVDLLLGGIQRVSLTVTGTQGNLNSEGASPSWDGRYVAFWSNASNLVPGDTNGTGDVFLRDTIANSTTRVSTSQTNGQGNGNAGYPGLSGDGAFLAFPSDASNLLMGDTNGLRDVFVKRLSTGSLLRVGLGIQPDGPSDDATLSHDGRYVAFRSEATNLVPGDSNGVADVFVQDLFLGTLQRVSVGAGGAQADAESEHPWISSDGQFVTFTSYATNLVAGDTNGWKDVFVHDLETGLTERLSTSTAGGQSNSLSSFPHPSAGAQVVAFTSFGSNLVGGDSNFAPDVFVRSRPDEPEMYCFGDGSGAACPCGNGGPAGSGCLNSSGFGGLLGTGGSTSVTSDDLRLDARRLIPGQPALAFAGFSQISGGAGVPFGDGLRCVAEGVVRLAVELPDAQGDAFFGPGLAALGGWGVGDQRYFQVWYRDPIGGPCGSGFNLTNALAALFLP